MSRCKETSGVLFRHPCKDTATASCIRCQKPICDRHFRLEGQQVFCISCLRTELRERTARGSRAHLRDDPYFYWYFCDDDVFDDPYFEEDYRLFDDGPQATAFGDDDLDHAWEGS